MLRTVLNISPKSTPPGTPQFEKKMSCLTKSTLRMGNKATPLFNGEQAFPAMSDIIRKAEYEINMEVYILREDQTSNHFTQALQEKAQQNVKVQFITDDIGNSLRTLPKVKSLRKNNVDAHVFNPWYSWTFLRYNNRNHRKILTVDGKKAVVSGLNVGNEYRGDGVTGYRDAGVLLEGPIVNDINISFAKMWEQSGPGWFHKDLPIISINGIKRYIDHMITSPFESKKRPVTGFIPQQGTCAVRFIESAPDNLASKLLDMHLLAINSAKKNVYIETGYFVPPILLQRAMKNAARRGVEVKLLLQGKTDQNFVRQLGINKFGRLIKAGVEIYEWPYSIQHAKVIMVDGIWSSIGSCNLDGRSFFLNYEANVAITDEEFTKAMQATFLNDIQLADPITLKEWKKRPTYKKLSGLLITPIKGQF